MNLKVNKTKALKVLFKFIATLLSILLYDSIYSFISKNTLISLSEKASTYGTSAIISFMILFFSWVSNKCVDNCMGPIMKDSVVWNRIKDGKTELKIKSKSTTLSYIDKEAAICRLMLEIKCQPQKKKIFSFMKFLGYGLLLYDNSSAFSFAKTNNENAKRYYISNNGSCLFVKSFYVADRMDNGLTLAIPFDIKLIDDVVTQSNIYVSYAWGIKGHKFKNTKLRVQNNQLKIIVKRL